MRTFYKPGSWNAICDVCGIQCKSDMLKKRWDGLMVCAEDWETRHIAEFFKPPPTRPNIPWARPDPEIPAACCNLNNSISIAGTGVAGCAVAGRASFLG